MRVYTTVKNLVKNITHIKMYNELKLCAISDLHGTLPLITESADIMIIAGDISPLRIQRNHPSMLEWLHTEFVDWIMKLPVDKVYLTPGNHDFWFESQSKTAFHKLENLTMNKMQILVNESVSYIDKFSQSWLIFGTPYCHIFGNWPFMRSESYIEEKFKKIPDVVDIIISHDPPYGSGADQILERRRWNNTIPEYVGNKQLTDRIKNVDFKLLLCGHIHSGEHSVVPFHSGFVSNVSILDEQYNEHYIPQYYTLKK